MDTAVLTNAPGSAEGWEPGSSTDGRVCAWEYKDWAVRPNSFGVAPGREQRWQDTQLMRDGYK